MIVVNDGSTDEGPTIVGRYLDPRLRLVSQENRGLSGARNRGVAKSQADWVAFLDADDEWMPEFLAKTLAVIEANPRVSLVFTNVLDPTSGTTRLPVRTGTCPVGDFFSFHVEHRRNSITPSAVVIRQKAIVEAGGFAEDAVWRYGEDIDMWVRLAWMENEMACLWEPLALYHVEAAGRLSLDRDHYLHLADQAAATYRLWNKEGRIPARFCKSSLRFFQGAVVARANLLTDIGERSEARRVLRSDTQPRLSGHWVWWKAYLGRPILDSC